MGENQTAARELPAGKAPEKYKCADRPYQLRMVDHILDNLYGQIGITRVEKELELQPIFKRLHNISQLGAVNWIFPCAVHTRYVHSLGVMQMAHDMATHINMNEARGKCGQEPFFSDSEIQIIRLAGMLHDIGHYPLSHNIEAAYKEGAQERQNVRRSVLEQQRNLVGCPGYLAADGETDPAGGGRDPFLHDPHSEDAQMDKQADYLAEIAGSKGYHHEAIGAAIIEHNSDILEVVKEHFVLMPAGGEEEHGGKRLNPICVPLGASPDGEFDAAEITGHLLKMIAAIVRGNYDYKPASGGYPFEEKYSAMVQIIHSELDADNLDYLLRDATFSGTSYGVMDVGILLNCLTVSPITLHNLVESGEVSRRYVVGILPKGIGCVEQFFSNKYLAYSQMIFSKYVSALEAMLLNWARYSLPQNEVYGLEANAGERSPAGKKGEEIHEPFLKMVNSPRTEPSYLHFTDAFVLQEIYKNFTDLLGIEKRRQGQPDIVRRAILSRLVNYTSFELKDKRDSECLSVGFGEEEIREYMKEQPLYQEYAALLKEIGTDMTVGELHQSAYSADPAKNLEQRLLSYRFESYSMTKQIPFGDFCVEIAPPGCDFAVLRHYYRLTTGVPILPGGGSYSLSLTADGTVERANMPDLVVDVKSSSLSTIWKQKFVYLRKYDIQEIGKRADA